MVAAGLPPELSSAQLVAMLRRMLLIRRFEERAVALYQAAEMRGTTHVYVGMEAVAVGACTAIRPTDAITSTHRVHGHCLAKGGEPRLMMAELLGRAAGLCKGRGGSLHIADIDRGMLGANGIVGGGIGLATGAALAAKLAGKDDVCLCFFGDGALNQGILHEASNLAAVWSLPVVYICENNQYAMSARADKFAAVIDAPTRAAAYGFPGWNVDGMDVIAVYSAVANAVVRARRGEGAALLVCTTYRYLGHHAGDPSNYRDKLEVERWRPLDPITQFTRVLTSHHIVDETQIATLQGEVEREIEAAVEFAKASPKPNAAALIEDVYA